MSSSTLQRPALHGRQASSSSFAEAFEIARSRLVELNEDLEAPITDDESPASPGSLISDRSPASLASPITNPITPALDPDVADNFAFAFDIDGVLVRGGKVIPEAVEAMKVLNGENEYGVRV